MKKSLGVDKNRVIKYLKIQSGTVIRLEPKVSRSLGVEPIHQLRVATRRVRTIVWVLQLSTNLKHIKKFKHELQAVAKMLGHVRELDVAILDAKQYGINSSVLIKKRKTNAKKLQMHINRNHRKHLAKQLSEITKTVAEINPKLLNKAYKHLALQLNKQLKQNLNKETSLHQLRITLKKARYAIEAMGKPVKPLKELQQILGDAHDLETLQGFLGKNKKVKDAQQSLNGKAVPLVKPALLYALTQLKNK